MTLRDRHHTALPAARAVKPGAGHLFEEPGALEMVARLAGDWFARHLSASTTPVAATAI